MTLAGFKIAVNDPASMCLVERAGDFNAVLQDLIEWQGADAQAVLERLAIEVLHDQIVEPVLTPDVVEHADMRVAETGNGARFPFEPLPAGRIVRDVRRHHLDRDVAVEPTVPGAIDRAHAPRAERGNYLRTVRASCLVRAPWTRLDGCWAILADRLASEERISE